MTIFKFLDLAFQLVLGVVDGLTNVVSSPVGFFRGDFLVRLAYLLRRLFRAPPGFLHRTLHLVEDSLVGQFIVANGLTNVLLYLSNSLVKFSSNLILIHGRLSSLGLNRNYLGDMSGGGHRRRVRNFPASGIKQPEPWPACHPSPRRSTKYPARLCAQGSPSLAWSRQNYQSERTGEFRRL